jgi:hypothetical protein
MHRSVPPLALVESGKAQLYQCAQNDAQFLSRRNRGFRVQRSIHSVGLMFWFRRKKFVGSYLFLSKTSRS